ncbi:MAG TPA: HAD family hydrolase [Phycisphaerae bacterium]|jgi:2-haloalkanoic acid dehalogenase type II
MAKLAEIRSKLTTLSFDCYGTLIDWETGIRVAFESLLDGSQGMPIDAPTLIEAYLETEAEIQDRGYRPYRKVQAAALLEVARRFELTVPPQKVHILADSLPDWRPFIDTNAALLELKKRFRLGIVSNIDQNLLEGTMRHLAVPFDFVITAEDVRAYKPSHPHFLRLLESVADPLELLHVAQSVYHDGVPATQLGLAWAWINRKGEMNRTAGRPVLEARDLQQLVRELASIPQL